MAETLPFLYGADLVRNVATGEHVALCCVGFPPSVPLERYPLGQGATPEEAIGDLECTLEQMTGRRPCAVSLRPSVEYVCLECAARPRFEHGMWARHHRLAAHHAVSYLPDPLSSLG